MLKSNHSLFEQEINKLSSFMSEMFPNELPGKGETIVDVAIRVLSPSEEKTGYHKTIKMDYIGRTSRCRACQGRIVLVQEGWVHMAPYAHRAFPDPEYVPSILQK